jgi:phosphoglycerol transferase
VALLGFGLLDQTNAGSTPNYAVIDRAWKSDETFVHGVEQRLPTGAMVYQLPFIIFAQSPTRFELQGYDLMKGFTHSKNLRWSYGGLQGREADWQYGASRLPPDDLVALLAGIGFDGLTIDRAGYEDHAAGIERALTALVGGPDLVSPDERLSFFDLSKARARLHRDATTGWFENASGRPVPAATADVPDARLLDGALGDTDTAELSRAPTRLVVYGLTDRVVSVDVVATVDVEGVVPADLAIDVDGQRVPITHDGQEVRIPFSASMGKTTRGVALVGAARARLHIVRVDIHA